MAQKVWFITGTSRGFGREWAEAALERGDLVAAAARDVRTLDPVVAKYGDAVLPLTLDVVDRAADFEAIRQAHERFGRLDVVVNNAGYGFFGAIEEATEEQARRQIDTNLFGPLWITQAALPILRAQGSGHIIQVSSVGGIAAFANLGLYHASKWGLEGFSEALAQEVAPFGIKVTIVEPSGFSTDWRGSSAVHAAPMPEYEAAHAASGNRAATWKAGDPAATSAAIMRIVDAEDPPLRILFGETAATIVPPLYAQRLATWAEWEDVSRAAGGS